MTPARATAPPRRGCPRRAGEAGSVSLFGAIVAVALLAAVGLAVDGGAKVRATQQADAYAEEAARAGGQAIEAAPAIQGEAPRLDPRQAARAAQAHLDAAGVPGTARLTGPDSLRVEVTITRPTVFLGLIGINTVTAHGHAQARLVRGVTGEEP
jgi:Putative Flp pilus-assembly TadE/G-like